MAVSFRKHVVCKAVALIVCFAFIWQSVGPIGDAYAQGAVESASPSALTHDDVNKSSFNLPVRFGEIIDFHKGALDNTIIHIRDAHCDYSAQHSISDIIGYFRDTYNVDLVALEGGSGDYDLSVFTDIKDGTLRGKVADYFVGQGEVNGAEFYAINNPLKVTLYGIEDPALYIENLNAYRNSLKYKDKALAILMPMAENISRQKDSIYPPNFRELDKKIRLFREDKLGLEEYAAAIAAYAKDNNVDTSGYPNIERFYNVMDHENGINMKEAERERNILIDLLNKRLSKKYLEELVAKTVEFNDGDMPAVEYYAYLMNRAELCGIELGSMQNLLKYSETVKKTKNVNKKALAAEFKALEEKMCSSFLKTDEQRTLCALDKKVFILERLFSIGLVKDDWDYYTAHRKDFEVKEFAGLNSYRLDMEKFYTLSLKRDDVFINKIMAKLKKDNQKNVILITGGFHQDNLKDIFEDKGYSYIEVLPKMEKSDSENQYFRLLSGGVDPITRAISETRSNLQIATYFDKVLGAEVHDVKSFDKAVKVLNGLLSEGDVDEDGIRFSLSQFDGSELLKVDGEQVLVNDHPVYVSKGSAKPIVAEERGSRYKDAISDDHELSDRPGTSRQRELMAEGKTSREAFDIEIKEAGESGVNILRSLKKDDMLEDAHGGYYLFDGQVLSYLRENGKGSGMVYGVTKGREHKFDPENYAVMLAAMSRVIRQGSADYEKAKKNFAEIEKSTKQATPQFKAELSRASGKTVRPQLPKDGLTSYANKALDEFEKRLSEGDISGAETVDNSLLDQVTYSESLALAERYMAQRLKDVKSAEEANLPVAPQIPAVPKVLTLDVANEQEAAIEFLSNPEEIEFCTPSISITGKELVPFVYDKNPIGNIIYDGDIRKKMRADEMARSAHSSQPMFLDDSISRFMSQWHSEGNPAVLTISAQDDKIFLTLNAKGIAGGRYFSVEYFFTMNKDKFSMVEKAIRADPKLVYEAIKRIAEKLGNGKDKKTQEYVNGLYTSLASKAEPIIVDNNGIASGKDTPLEPAIKIKGQLDNRYKGFESNLSKEFKKISAASQVMPAAPTARPPSTIKNMLLMGSMLLALAGTPHAKAVAGETPIIIPGAGRVEVSTDMRKQRQAAIDRVLENLHKLYEARKTELSKEQRDLMSDILRVMDEGRPEYKPEYNFAQVMANGRIGINDDNCTSDDKIEGSLIHESIHLYFKSKGIKFDEKEKLDGFTDYGQLTQFLIPGEEGAVISKTRDVLELIENMKTSPPGQAGMKFVYVQEGAIEPETNGVIFIYDGMPVTVSDVAKLSRKQDIVMEKRMLLTKVLALASIDKLTAVEFGGRVSSADQKIARQELTQMGSYYKEATRQSYERVMKLPRMEDRMKKDGGMDAVLAEAFKDYHSKGPVDMSDESKTVIDWYSNYRCWMTVQRSLQLLSNLEAHPIKPTAYEPAIQSRSAVSVPAANRSLNDGLTVPGANPILGAMHEDGAGLFAEMKSRFGRVIDRFGWDTVMWRIARRQTDEDDALVKQAIKALIVAGVPVDMANKVYGRILLVKIGDRKLEHEGDRLGGLIVRHRGILKILFPRQRIEGMDAKALGDLLHEMVEIELIERGVQVDDAHWYALQIRDMFIRGDTQALRAGLEKLFDPYRLGRFETGFDTAVSSALKSIGVEDKKQDLTTLSDADLTNFLSSFSGVLQKQDSLWWNSPLCRRFLNIAKMMLTKENLDKFKSKHGRFDAMDLVLTLQRMHALAANIWQVGFDESLLEGQDMDYIVSIMAISNASRFRMLSAVSLAGDNWENVKADQDVLAMLKERKMAVVLNRFSQTRPISEALPDIKAICEFFGIDISKMENNYILNTILEFEKDKHEFIERADKESLREISADLADHFLSGGIFWILAVCHGMDKNGVLIDKFIARGYDGIVLSGMNMPDNRKVAVKVNIMQNGRTSKNLTETLRAITAKSDHHDNFSENIDIGEMSLKSSRPAVIEVNEFVNGVTLQDLILRSDLWDVGLPQLMNIAIQLMEVEEFLIHGIDCINTDVQNPRNYIVTPKGTLKLVDFGNIWKKGDIEKIYGKKVIEGKVRDHWKRSILLVVRVLFGVVLADFKPTDKAVFADIFVKRFGENNRQTAEKLFDILLSAKGKTDKEFKALIEKLRMVADDIDSAALTAGTIVGAMHHDEPPMSGVANEYTQRRDFGTQEIVLRTPEDADNFYSNLDEILAGEKDAAVKDAIIQFCLETVQNAMREIEKYPNQGKQVKIVFENGSVKVSDNLELKPEQALKINESITGAKKDLRDVANESGMDAVDSAHVGLLLVKTFAEKAGWELLPVESKGGWTTFAIQIKSPIGQMKVLSIRKHPLDEDAQFVLKDKAVINRYRELAKSSNEVHNGIRFIYDDLGDRIGGLTLDVNTNPIVIINVNMEGDVQQEAEFHEEREIYWMRKGLSQHHAHIVASAEGVVKYSNNGAKLTPYHNYLLTSGVMALEEMEVIFREIEGIRAKTHHHIVLKYKGVDALAVVKIYERKIRQTAYEAVTAAIKAQKTEKRGIFSRLFTRPEWPGNDADTIVNYNKAYVYRADNGRLPPGFKLLAYHGTQLGLAIAALLNTGALDNNVYDMATGFKAIKDRSRVDFIDRSRAMDAGIGKIEDMKNPANKGMNTGSIPNYIRVDRPFVYEFDLTYLMDETDDGKDRIRGDRKAIIDFLQVDYEPVPFTHLTDGCKESLLRDIFVYSSRKFSTQEKTIMAKNLGMLKSGNIPDIDRVNMIETSVLKPRLITRSINGKVVEYGRFDPLTGTISVDIAASKKAFADIIKGLDDVKITGFVHAHELFHSLISNKGIKLPEQEEEKLAGIFAMKVMGLSPPQDEAYFKSKISDSDILKQFSTAYSSEGFLLNLRNLGIDIYNIENVKLASSPHTTTEVRPAEPINVRGDDGKFKYFNPAVLPNGTLLSRRVSVETKTSKPHRSDIARLIPSGGKVSGVEFVSGGVVIENAEDPRVMQIGGRIAMTFVRPYNNGRNWNSYLVFLNEDGTVSGDGQEFKLGRPDVNSKNTYLVELANGKIAMIDRANQPDEPASVQVYIFDSLKDALNPPNDYWQKHTIESATVLRPDTKNAVSHIGFNTVVTAIEENGRKEIVAFTHKAKSVSDEDKKYVTAVVIFDAYTLQPLGEPAELPDIAENYLKGDVSNVVYETGATLSGDKIISYAGVSDSKIMRFESTLESIVKRFWDHNAPIAKPVSMTYAEMAGQIPGQAAQMSDILSSILRGKPYRVIVAGAEPTDNKGKPDAALIASSKLIGEKNEARRYIEERLDMDIYLAHTTGVSSAKEEILKILKSPAKPELVSFMLSAYILSQLEKDAGFKQSLESFGMKPGSSIEEFLRGYCALDIVMDYKIENGKDMVYLMPYFSATGVGLSRLNLIDLITTMDKNGVKDVTGNEEYIKAYSNFCRAVSLLSGMDYSSQFATAMKGKDPLAFFKNYDIKLVIPSIAPIDLNDLQKALDAMKEAWRSM